MLLYPPYISTDLEMLPEDHLEPPYIAHGEY